VAEVTVELFGFRVLTDEVQGQMCKSLVPRKRFEQLQPYAEAFIQMLGY